jgi:hypothetical protein
LGAAGFAAGLVAAGLADFAGAFSAAGFAAGFFAAVLPALLLVVDFANLSSLVKGIQPGFPFAPAETEISCVWLKFRRAVLLLSFIYGDSIGECKSAPPVHCGSEEL